MDCLSCCMSKVSNSVLSPSNLPVIFLKPHANNKTSVTFVKNFLAERKIRIISEITKSGKELDSFIDDHYSVLSRPAIYISPKDLAVDSKGKEKFKEIFNEEFDDAKIERIFNASEFLESPYCAEEEDKLRHLELWESSSCLKAVVGQGIIIGLMETGESGNIYVVNIFYPEMRKRFVAGSVTAFVVEFPEDAFSWETFRKDIIGKTNPAKAVHGSLRREILDKWRELALPSEPNYTDNGVHASAGPLEALRERIIWFDWLNTKGFSLDYFGQKLLLARRSLNDIADLASRVDLFDATEDMNSSEAILKIVNRSEVV